jgi:uncharacterized protein with HEPN domain
MAPSRNPLARLRHVLDEMDQLAAAMADVNFEAFAASYMHRRTAEHAILIISEAIRSLPAELTDQQPGPNWRAMRGIGNVLRHDYYAIEPPVLWDILSLRLPELRPVILHMIEEVTQRDGQ